MQKWLLNLNYFVLFQKITTLAFTSIKKVNVNYLLIKREQIITSALKSVVYLISSVSSNSHMQETIGKQYPKITLGM